MELVATTLLYVSKARSTRKTPRENELRHAVREERYRTRNEREPEGVQGICRVHGGWRAPGATPVSTTVRQNLRLAKAGQPCLLTA